MERYGKVGDYGVGERREGEGERGAERGERRDGRGEMGEERGVGRRSRGE